MGIIRLSVERPLTMLMFIIALAAIGWRGFNEMNVDRFPTVDFPFITVISAFPGASPEDVETLIVEPIEDAVSTIPGIDFVQSNGYEGAGVIIVAFTEDVDGDQAATEVERQVATVRGQLPDEASDPSIVKADINAIPIMEIILSTSGLQSQDDLFKLAEDVISPRLESINGVASLSISGGRDKIIAVELEPAQLAAFDLPLSTINQAFSINNLTFPVGSVEDGNLKSNVRSVGSFQTLAEIQNLVVSGAPNPFGGGGGGGPPPPSGEDEGGLVYLSDVAVIRESFKDETLLQRYNGQDTVAISVIKTSESNAIAVADVVRDRIGELNDFLSGGAQLTIVEDTSDFTRRSVRAVQEDLVTAIIITGLIMLLFLHTIRSTAIVLLAIPTSLISTFLVMWMAGFTLNVLTLLALTLIIGILVDNSIVVIENIERHLRMGKTPKRAAIDGPSEIGVAALAITLTDVIVYVPVAFTSGIIGQFFFSYGITIVAATMFSLFISFTLAPILASVFLKDPNVEDVPAGGVVGVFGKLFGPIGWVWNRFTKLWDAGFVKLAEVYASTIRFSLRNVLTQSIVIIIAIVALGISLSLIPQIGGEFIPAEDDGRFTVNLTLPPASNLSVVDQAARQAEQIVLREVPEVSSLLTRVGSRQGNLFAGGNSAANSASIQARLPGKNDRERTLNEIVESLRDPIAKIPDATVTITAGGGGGGPGGGLQVQVLGQDPDILIGLANQIEEILLTTEGTVDVINDDAVLSPETRINFDRARLTKLGLSPALVATTLRTAVTGSDVGDFAPENQEKIEINLRVGEDTRRNMDQLLQMPIGYMQGRPVLLEQVAEIERSTAPSRINRLDGLRVLTVSAGVLGSDAQGVTDTVENRINNEIIFPANHEFQFGGDTENQRESFAQLGAALLLSIFLTYILLVATFQNLLQPFAIMFSLPLALIGVLWGLYLSGNTLNIFSLLGVIMLVGVVTRNAILIIDFANILQREQGVARKESLVEAGRLRLRPIMMTSATLLFALLPVLLSTADGSETRQPLAAVLMGGAVTSSFLSLIVIPVVYNMFEALGDGLKRIGGTLAGRRSPSESEPRLVPPAPAPEATSGD
ncbi:MAG: efflux RND transporter permease subunit [Chloroflexota bacterium]